VVGGDDEVSIGPFRIFVSADQEFEGELFENEIVSGLEFVSESEPRTALGSVMSWTRSSSASLVSKEFRESVSRIGVENRCQRIGVRESVSRESVSKPL